MLLADHERRAEMGRHAREYAQQFTWTSTADHWERLLTEVAQRRAPVAMTDARSRTRTG
jgi:glycosyltransferase involved in cell wall biosynthesis